MELWLGGICIFVCFRHDTIYRSMMYKVYNVCIPTCILQYKNIICELIELHTKNRLETESAVPLNSDPILIMIMDVDMTYIYTRI